MKNLSLQMTETSLKKPADAINKSTVSKSTMASDGVAQAENNASFQMMLNKQVQAKQASAREVENRQNQAKQPQKTVGNGSTTTKPENTEATTNQKNAQKVSQLQLAMMATNRTKVVKDAQNIDPMQLAEKDIVALDAKPVLFKETGEAKAGADDKAVSDVSLTDKASITDISNAQMLSSMMSEIKQAPLGKAAETGEGAMSAEKQLTLGADRGSVLKDDVLSNALSQGKNASDAKDLTAVDDKESRHDWIDAMLPNASKPSSGDDMAKLMLKSEKESAIREVAMPANYQSTSQLAGQSSMQANAAEAMQQLGSSNTINAYPGKTGWDQAISQKVVWMLGAQEQSATLTLNPPDMGPLQVVIHVHNDQADTTFISDNAEVRQALQDGMDNLRNKMNESGIQLGQANVSSGGQMQQQFQQAAQQSKASASLNNNASASPIGHVSSAKTVIRTSNGLVDTFV
ncbi:flagellar hook-length control protein FliK [Methylotenera sp.]|uniref:flagellar hook-length control protein FliK n=1 Tax=Methylotenera sp. TaxID=2051956 RepID=UPI0024870E98|nr:flagellar hook-length control protein FliK [Methylotenera sp.]MDI1299342.1 flagellar hook-length control protein FliK [Methylotenera sp.]